MSGTYPAPVDLDAGVAPDCRQPVAVIDGARVGPQVSIKEQLE